MPSQPSLGAAQEMTESEQGERRTMTDFTRTHPAFTRRTLERPGCTIHYWTAGEPDARPVLALHGATADHRMFNAQVEPLLKAGYRLAAWDARGHGDSQPLLGRPTITDFVDDALALLNAEGMERAVLIGQSMGSYVAQHLVRLHPQRAAALVVVGGTPIALGVSRADLLALRATLPMFRVWPWKSLQRLTARSTARVPAVQEYMADSISRMDKDTFLTVWASIGTAISTNGFGWWPDNLPVLWTLGDHDRTGNIAKDAPRLAALGRPEVTVVEIPNAGHNANQDNPDFFNSTMMPFLASLPDPS